MSRVDKPSSSPHARSVAAVLDDLETSTRGLSETETLRRREVHGRNELGERTGHTLAQRVIAQFNNSLVLVLVAAAVISGVLLREWVDAAVIAGIVVLNATLGIVQEGRAERALAKLAELSAPTATVIRDGVEREVASSDVVPGDVVVLEAGGRVAADARLVDAIRLQVDEAILTGESTPVHKHTEPVEVDDIVADRTNMVFAGTMVSAGRGLAVVTHTGDTTEFGRVVDLLDTEQPQTPLAIELDRVGRQIAVLALALSVVIFVLGTLRDIPVETMFLTSVAVAVAAIPEGLSALVTMTLSQGVWTMATHNAIVRRLPAVEALGAANVICTDKTGTLTRNRIEVNGTWSPAESTDLVARIAVLCNDARPSATEPGTYLGEPTEVALLRHGEELLGGPDAIDALRAELPREAEVAFDSNRKRMTTAHRVDGSLLLFTKGAPEVILDRCTQIVGDDGPQEFTDAARSRVEASADEFARQGLRVLALAYRDVDRLADALEDDEHDETFVALVSMSDAPRPEAADAVRRAQRAGLQVVMITGDHLDTAQAIGRELGILTDSTRGITGRQLREMTPDELAAAVDDIAVYARVEPADKLDIVRAWRSRDAIVAMTGDGVNDAPALRAADIGISMGSGTAVAQEASSVVLADDNFATIVTAIEQGRRIFQNISRVVYFLLSANVSELLVMMTAIIAFGSIGEPLLATQLLWINLVTDSFPALALGADRVTGDVLDGPAPDTHHILDRHRLVRLLWQGAILAGCALAAFIVSYFWRDAGVEHARTVLFTALVLVQVPHVYTVRSERHDGHRTPGASPWIAAAAVVSVVLQIGVVYTGIGNRLFGTTPLDALDWAVLAAAAIGSFLIIRAILVVRGRH